MSAKYEIAEKLKEAYAPSDVNAGQVYKGHGYDGSRQANGWWFRPFNGSPVYLGQSKDSAYEIIDQIVEGRQE